MVWILEVSKEWQRSRYFIVFCQDQRLVFIFIITVLFGRYVFHLMERLPSWCRMVKWRQEIYFRLSYIQPSWEVPFASFEICIHPYCRRWVQRGKDQGKFLWAIQRSKLLMVKKRTSAPLGGKIQYSQVGFAYPSRQDLPVLKGIDLDVEKAKNCIGWSKWKWKINHCAAIDEVLYPQVVEVLPLMRVPIDQYNFDLRHQIELFLRM